ncbi:DUF6961 family protein [Sphingobium yanoikuyae]|uniref:DUF6961 family protein n=1 Tax=Sphingobium yanoikuyae TaxID=13690 RepID=UPI000262C0BC
MTPEKERWAEALAVERRHGDNAFDFVARRIQDLAIQGDEAGVERWITIAGLLGDLTPDGTLQYSLASSMAPPG